MKILRFRAFDKVTKKMSPVFHLFGEFTLLRLVHDWQYESGNKEGDSLGRLNDLVIMQFTGLTDKAGKEIYEGDVVQNVTDDGRRLSIFEISWQQSSCGFIKEREDGSRFTLEISRHIEVIGNIYENGHLLKYPDLINPT